MPETTTEMTGVASDQKGMADMLSPTSRPNMAATSRCTSASTLGVSPGALSRRSPGKAATRQYSHMVPQRLDECEVAARVVLAGLVLLAGLRQEHGGGLAGVNRALHYVADAGVRIPLYEAGEQAVLRPRRGAAVACDQDVELLVVKLLQRPVQGKVTKGVEVDDGP